MILVPGDTVLRILLDLQYLLMRVRYFYLIAIIQTTDVVIDANLGQVSECLVVVAEAATVLDNQSIVHFS